MLKTHCTHPCIRLVDDSPSRGSQLHSGEVKGGNIVGIVLESTVNTTKETLTFPVSLIDVSTPRARYGGVLRRDVNYWYSSFKSLVLDKGLEFPVCPTVEVSILTFPMLSSVTDSSQLFHNNYVTFFKAVHKLPADLMQHSINPSSLSSTQPFQLPFGGSCAFGLERGAEPSKMPSPSENVFSFSFEAVGGNKKIIHTDVNTNRVIPFRLWNCLINCDMEEEGFVSVNQDCVGRLNIFKEFSLILSNVKWRLHSLLNGRDRCIDAISFIDKSKQSLIQVHGKLRELKQFIPSLLVGFSNSVSRSYGKVCWEVKPSSGLSVNHVVESNWVKHPSFKGYFRNVVTGIPESLNRAKQLLRVFSRRLKFADDGLGELHTKAYMLIKHFKVFLLTLQTGLLVVVK